MKTAHKLRHLYSGQQVLNLPLYGEKPEYSQEAIRCELQLPRAA